MDVRGKRVLVVGLARSGEAVAHALARHGAVVTVSDRKPPAEFREMLPQLLKEKIGLELGSQRLETFLTQQAIVISPGVPWDLPYLDAARAQKIPIYPEVEAATWFLEGTMVGVTGSNGKTTTTALLGDMLKASGFPTFVGGNIGNALSSAVDHAQPGTIFVTELSSFQLEGIQEFRPDVAVMLNLSPNHLDRHRGLEVYAQAKRQIFRNQRAQDFAILNVDDPWVSSLRTVVPSQTVPFSRQRELAHGVFVAGGKIYYRVRHLERVLFETRDVTLRGSFNLENVLAATAAACTLGADFAAIRKAVREFQAVEHRLEFVGEIQGVDFYNNSKATSVDATAKSLEAFERGVHLILGGKDKGAPYTPLLPLIKERVRTVLLIGAAAPVIAAQLAGEVELLQAGDLATAVREAFLRARPGDTVLLAPACSSFDQFEDYEQRGRLFKELVKQLAGEVAAGSLARLKTVGVTAQEPVAPREDYPEAFAPPVPPSETAAPASVPAEEPAGAVIALSPPGDGGPEGPVETSEAPSECEATPQPAPAENGPRPLVPAAPQYVELRYVYEVDAMEMPAMESQVVPEEEPVTLERATGTEVNGDEPLPFEVRAENRDGATPPPGRKGSAKRKGREKAEDRQDSPPPSSEPRSRLPGMD